MLAQKQIKHQSYPTLAALTASNLTSPAYAFIESENKFYTKIAGVNTIINPSSGGTGATNLTYTPSPTNGTVLSDTGTDAIIPLADATNAGLFTSAEKAKVGFITVTTPVNLDTIGTGITALQTLSGVAAGSTNLGTFTGTTIGDNVTNKVAIQTLETSLETKATDSLVVHLAGAETITGVKTFTPTSQPVGINSTSLINTPSGTIAATTTQAAINELATEKQENIGFYEENVLIGTVGQYSKINFIGTSITATQDGTDTNKLNVTLSPSTGTSVYLAGNGAIVTATGTGVTFTRTTASVWTFNIPTGVELLSFDINSNPSQSATAALDIDFVFAGVRVYNQDTSVDMTDARVPVITTLKKVTPAQYPTTAATNNPNWTADVATAGTLRIATTEFTEVAGGGGQSTTVKGVF